MNAELAQSVSNAVQSLTAALANVSAAYTRLLVEAENRALGLAQQLAKASVELDGFRAARKADGKILARMEESLKEAVAERDKVKADLKSLVMKLENAKR
jgi:hypothetical protein